MKTNHTLEDMLHEIGEEHLIETVDSSQETHTFSEEYKKKKGSFRQAINAMNRGEEIQTQRQDFLSKFIEEEVKPLLQDGEEIQGYFPMTTDGQNSSVTGVGLLGMMTVKTEKGKEYVKEFQELRGNRMLLFTDTRILFITPLELLEENLYYSYPYDSIGAITIKKHSARLFGKGRPEVKGEVWYLLDFQSETHIFTEMISEAHVETLKELMNRIPAFGQIPLAEKINRGNFFDRVASNLDWLYVAMKTSSSWALVLGILIYLVFIAYLVWRFLL
jgi:hypothetical protein